MALLSVKIARPAVTKVVTSAADAMAADAAFNARIEAILAERMTRMMAVVMATMLKAFEDEGEGAKHDGIMNVDRVMARVCDNVSKATGSTVDATTLRRDFDELRTKLWGK